MLLVILFIFTDVNFNPIIIKNKPHATEEHFTLFTIRSPFPVLVRPQFRLKRRTDGSNIKF